ncbi:MAG: DNA mismatch repair protein MutS [Firmicutes bacterium ADurb.Bin182]|nr:MAG: DNA mismatch repair protein MutS [Firmicutes bacterium ADurb.Bin182]
MPGNITPMMRQYLELKEKYSDCLLFFRLGDFYEMFFEDAETASKELDIVLTGRDCGLDKRAPMCGVPYHSVENYINKLIEKGYKVAICEQLSDPNESKGVVERDVIRIITPGTVIEESMLSEGKNNYIAAVFLQEKRAGIAFSDVSTGSFEVLEIENDTGFHLILNELARIQPTEIIVNDAVYLQEQLIKSLQLSYYVQCLASGGFQYESAKERLQLHFKVASLDGFGCKGLECAISAAGALILYLKETQKNELSHINKITVAKRSEYMCLDASTRRNLELTQPLRFDGNKKSTLLDLLDRTETAMGARMLKSWLEQPLLNADKINSRLNAVEELVNNVVFRKQLKDALGSVYDIERLSSRIAYGTVNARDCVSLRCTLEKLPRIIELTGELKSDAFKSIFSGLDPMEDIYAILEASIAENPPVSVKEGGIIKPGYNSEIDMLRTASQNGKSWLAKLEADEKEKTGIRNLKIGYNRVFGYYIEVTKAYQHLVPSTYERKQTLANAERYITPELKKLEETILGSEDKCILLEYEVFTQIRSVLLECIERLKVNSALIAELDVYQSFAQTAADNKYCKPKIRKNGLIEIVDGRHPVVERMLKDGFIPNNTTLDNDANRMMIITGPNMAGKSTYMRQVALITLMAHCGSFVPASSAVISLTDNIFTRVGASDNLAYGQSTFMVEMSEMANIINNATSKSLLILDEIGRGTSTFDGLSIAWSVLEHISDKKLCGAKTLFATHYHELTELEGKLQGVKNYRVSVREIGDDIIFLRKIVRGEADKSFGIQVAQLAGLPKNIIVRAKEILVELEKSDINSAHLLNSLNDREEAQQTSLFGAFEQPGVIETIRCLNIDSITPMEALNMLYDLYLRVRIGQNE